MSGKRLIANDMSKEQWVDAIKIAPKSLIASNGKLKKSNIWQWSIPALHAAVLIRDKLTTIKTCPMAGACAQACYACQGQFIFKASMVAHARNLQAFINDKTGLAIDIVETISKRKKLSAFRIHDSGDFFNKSYAVWWFKIIEQLPNIQFYCYTKQVAMFKLFDKQGKIPANLSVIYSYGGKQDSLIDPSIDRHSKVFSNHQLMVDAGYVDTTETDANAADPSKRCIGLVYHGVKGVAKALGDSDIMGQ